MASVPMLFLFLFISLPQVTLAYETSSFENYKFINLGISPASSPSVEFSDPNTVYKNPANTTAGSQFIKNRDMVVQSLLEDTPPSTPRQKAYYLYDQDSNQVYGYSECNTPSNFSCSECLSQANTTIITSAPFALGARLRHNISSSDSCYLRYETSSFENHEFIYLGISPTPPPSGDYSNPNTVYRNPANTTEGSQFIRNRDMVVQTLLEYIPPSTPRQKGYTYGQNSSEVYGYGECNTPSNYLCSQCLSQANTSIITTAPLALGARLRHNISASDSCYLRYETSTFENHDFIILSIGPAQSPSVVPTSSSASSIIVSLVYRMAVFVIVLL